MRLCLLLVLLMPITNVLAEILPSLPSQNGSSSHKLFISSQNQTINDFDTWKIDSGYSYSLFDSVDVYVGARVDNSPQERSESGFLSGISYNLNERFSVQSTLHTRQEVLEDGKQAKTLGAEVSSRMQISEHVDLHATFDYQEWQQGVEFGLGFRF